MKARWLLHTAAVLLGASALLVAGEQVARAREENPTKASRDSLVERLAQRTEMRTATYLGRNIFAASAGLKATQKPLRVSEKPLRVGARPLRVSEKALRVKPQAQEEGPPATGPACGTTRPCTVNIKELKAGLQDLREVMKQAKAAREAGQAQTPQEPNGYEACFYKAALPLLAIRLEHIAPRIADELKRQADLVEKPNSSDQVGARLLDEQFRNIVAFTEGRLQGKIDRVEHPPK